MKRMFGNKKSQPEFPDDNKPKSKFDTLLTSTPVILTVLSTLLAGLSSSEMTKAQYHRALAAQNQSKAGDQWNFFQAKRIRGTSMDTSADVIAALAEPGHIDRARLGQFKTDLIAELDRVKADADKLVKQVNESKNAIGSSSDAVVRAATQLKESADRAAAQAAASQKEIGSIFDEDKSAAAFEAVATSTFPKVENTKLEDTPINEVLDAIRKRQTEKQTAKLMARVNEDTLADALDAAEENASRFDDACKPINKVLNVAATGVASQVRLTRSLQRASAGFNQAFTDAGVSDKKELEDVRKTAAGLTRTTDRMKTQAGQLYADVISGRHHFNARRYELEAGYNISIASLYEVQVRKSSWNSERHRTRSGYFFFGMLAAQAGVTIATLALAVKFRSILWSVASLAGLAAIGIAVVVYLYV
jgi:hypothetical protein